MTKYTLSIIALICIIELKASRLLQQYTQATCASTLCTIGTQCYETSNGPICCDPNICVKGRCGGNGLLECEAGYECVAGDCPKGMTDCPGNCVNPDAYAKPQIGDPCVGCRTLLCACMLCPGGHGTYGCCGGCTYKDDGHGNVICASAPITSETNCPSVPVEGASCGQQGIDCGSILAPEYTCSDGTGNCYGNCGTCTYQENKFGNLECLAAIIAQQDVCPSPVGCGIDYCDRYFDGCNDCGCDINGDPRVSPTCTDLACEQLSEPYCFGCSPGYTLNANTLKCEGCVCPMVYAPVWCNGQMYSNSCVAACNCPRTSSTTTLVSNPITSKCGGFDNCKTYYDGCRDCICGENGLDACTLVNCWIHGKPKCTECEFGYRINDENGQCVMKKSCDYNGDCDEINGFRCRFDPMCIGQINSNPLCTNSPNVCLDYESRNCQSDLDCDVTNGFKCYGVNGKENGVCGKYQ